MRALAVCCPILKLYNIDSRVLWARVLWRIAFLLLVLLAGVDFSVAYTLGGPAVSASMIYWRWMFRAAMRGDQHGGATVWAVGTFGEGVGGDISSSADTLGGDIKVTLGGGDVLLRRRDMMGNGTLKFSGAGLSAGAGR